ncbi:uncharacterized protein FTOL_05673 [Fusarium torulosum]|uniref:Protein kinase domain-containing protein n=1 Tax=Fusarium torulosum TaxID=33205 RepID=A0AAE8M8F7_9HYPO|nr:uncharacterized protein FTOL_05673 [Fusarium torulosum]
MADLGLAIAGVAGTIDVCIRLGQYMVQAYKDYGQSDEMVNELVVRVEICWSRIAGQLEISKELLIGMTDEQRGLQSRILPILQSKLNAATQAISRTDKHSTSKRIKALHFLTLRETLENTVVDLEIWQQRFEPSWFQIIKTGPPAVDAVLRNRDREEPAREGLRFRRAFDNSPSAFIAEKRLESLDKRDIVYCSAQLAIDQKDGKYYIVDAVSQETVKLKDARELASRLRDSNPSTFGILKCIGIVRVPEKASFVFVSRVPEGYSTVQSCRQLLLSGRTPDSLTKRLRIAQQLVTAVYYVHLYEFVHKNITPETILSLEKTKLGQDEAVVCLVGFQLIRNADARTNTSKADRKDSVYQHPSRMSSADISFTMQHDIYSLGVCLLEIGLWQSLVTYDDNGTTRISSALGITGSSSQNLNPDDIKAQLILLSRTQLRVVMGDIYSKVVETCLTCLDEGNMEFGDPRDFEDGDGVEVGSRYVKKIMDAMSIICY